MVIFVIQALSILLDLNLRASQVIPNLDITSIIENLIKVITKLPTNIAGIVLKIKFPKEESETHYGEYIYSIWRYCEEEETSGEVEVDLDSLDLPGDPLFIDWLQNEKNISKSDVISVSSTPIFLIVNEESTSGFVTFLKVVGIILLVLILVFIVGLVGLYCYKRFVKKKSIDLKFLIKAIFHSIYKVQ